MSVVTLAVYDFDKTVFSPDASFYFWLWLHKRSVLAWLDTLLIPVDALLLGMRWMTWDQFKSRRLRPALEWRTADQVQPLLTRFWEESEAHFHSWAKSQIESDKSQGLLVICISAGPETLLAQAAERLGFDMLIATRQVHVDGRPRAKLQGKRCKGYEKVNRLNTFFQQRGERYHIKRFYSDSLHDKPLYELSDEKFVVYRGTLSQGMPTRY